MNMSSISLFDTTISSAPRGTKLLVFAGLEYKSVLKI